MFVRETLTVGTDQIGGIHVEHDPGNSGRSLLRRRVELRHAFHVLNGRTDLFPHDDAVTRMVIGNAFAHGGKTGRRLRPITLVPLHQILAVEKSARSDNDRFGSNRKTLSLRFSDGVSGFGTDDGLAFLHEFFGSEALDDLHLPFGEFVEHSLHEFRHRAVHRWQLEGFGGIHRHEFDAVGGDEFDHLRRILCGTVQNFRIVFIDAGVNDRQRQIVPHLAQRLIVSTGANLLPIVFNFDVFGDPHLVVIGGAGRVELTGRHQTVAAQPETLVDHDHLRPGAGRRDGRRQSGKAAADDQNVGSFVPGPVGFRRQRGRR